MFLKTLIGERVDLSEVEAKLLAHDHQVVLLKMQTLDSLLYTLVPQATNLNLRFSLLYLLLERVD